MLPLSVSIVCRNNEGTIGRTLESVAGLASEIVAVDSGSTDGTIPLLERHGSRVIRSEWKGHIATKQMALDACTQPWVLCLDSDESAEAGLRVALEHALDRGDSGEVSGFEINRKVYYRSRPLNHVWQPEFRLRLVRRGQARWTGLDPHDRLEVTGGAVERLGGTIRHDSIPSFAEFLAKQAVHARTMAASMHAQGKRGSILKLLTSPPGAFLKQMVVKQAWRDGWPGWLAAGSTAAATLMKHIDLIELTRASRAGDRAS
jgi:hypothetical protein